MAILKRNVTPAMALANRANALKSTGPVIEQGWTNLLPCLKRA
jgi:hypothetical protein